MTAVAEKPETRADASRRQILEIAARLLRARGYAETSLRDIAAEAGMKAGSLYYHFASKDELATEVLRLGVERVREAVERRLRDLGEGASPALRVEAAIAAHLETLLLESDFTSAHIRCFPHAPAEVRRALAKVRRDYEGVWAKLVDEAAASGMLAAGADPRSARLAIIGALNWSLEWFVRGSDSTDKLARTIAAAFVCRDGRH